MIQMEAVNLSILGALFVPLYFLVLKLYIKIAKIEAYIDLHKRKRVKF